jgi:RNA polymerase sigma factor (sigma-70 family)
MAESISTVFVIDDDYEIRESLRLLLDSAGYRVKTFGSAEEFLESDQRTSESACIVLDVELAGLNGLELQRELTTKNHPMKVVFITGHGDIPMSVRAMKHGAVDFLCKPFDDDALLDAIEEALMKNSMAREHCREKNIIQRRLDLLTARESEILRYVIAGMLNKQIADALNISERTVKAHRKQVLKKMEVDSIAELVRLTEKVGIKPVKVLP